MGGQSLQSQIQSPHSRRGEQGAKIEALSSNLKGTQRQQTLKRLSSVVTVLPYIHQRIPFPPERIVSFNRYSLGSEDVKQALSWTMGLQS